MKRLITSAGLVALGVASAQAQNVAAPHLTSIETSKPWSVSATLRGFYDDNYSTRPSNPGSGPKKEDSFGFELSPSAELNWVLPQTYIGLSYVYGMRYYEARPKSKTDHSHQADLKLNHAFTERYKLDVSDSFVVAQEPDLLAKSGDPLRREGNNVRNSASLNFDAGLTDQLSVRAGYSNTFYDYTEDEGDVASLGGAGSLSSLLDRMEHVGTIDLRWQVLPNTSGILGYKYGVTDYNEGHELAPGIKSDKRDTTSHYVYVGADHSFIPQLNASVRGGAQITKYDNIEARLDDTRVSPYAEGNLTWTYNPGSYVQLGVRHTRLATDISFLSLALQEENLTLDQEATTIYSTINHRITPKLNGNIVGQFQHGSFESGDANNKTENIFLIGFNLSYEINKFLSADAGYNFDRLDSDIEDRSFSRNRVYLGIHATY